MSDTDWLSSERLFEENLFFYFLINLFWYLLGVFTIGFAIPEFDLPEHNTEINLLLNFIWMLCLCAAVCFPAFWYRLVFGKNAYLFRESKRIQDIADEFKNQKEYDDIIEFLHANGCTLLKRRHTIALSFLFMVALFDVFYIEAWMRNLALVWQPEWVNACIDWMKSHLSLPPLHKTSGWFLLSFEGSDNRIDGDRTFVQLFGSETGFINSPFGHAALFYHFIRTLLFIPIVAALCVLLWQPLLYLGGGKRYPPFIRGVKDFIGASLWSIVMGFFGVVGTLAIITSTTWFTIILFDIGIGLKMLHLQGAYLFVLPPTQFFIGWLIFWKRLAVRLFIVNVIYFSYKAASRRQYTQYGKASQRCMRNKAY